MDLPGCHPDVRCFQHNTRCIDLVDPNELPRIGASFILHARGDFEPEGCKEAVDQCRERGRSKYVNGSAKTSDPGLVEQWPELQRMIGVMMCDEDRVEFMRLHSCQQKLPCGAVAAVDQIG